MEIRGRQSWGCDRTRQVHTQECKYLYKQCARTVNSWNLIRCLDIFSPVGNVFFGGKKSNKHASSGIDLYQNFVGIFQLKKTSTTDRLVRIWVTSTRSFFTPQSGIRPRRPGMNGKGQHCPSYQHPGPATCTIAYFGTLQNTFRVPSEYVPAYSVLHFYNTYRRGQRVWKA